MTCSVIMTCYNEGPYIADAVRSVLSQTRQDLIDRIVIADDGSAASTIETLKALEQTDPRIRVLYGPGGGGLPAQRNLAATHCQGDYLAILDGDDLWMPTKIAEQCALLDAKPSVGLAYSGYCAFPDQDVSAAQPARVMDITDSKGGPHGALTQRYFLNDPPIIPSSIIVRRTLFDRVGGFDASIRVFEDTDFFLRLSRLCDFGFVPTPLLNKRNHSASITGGRKDLMAHHARVAFGFAATEPELLPLVPRRLAERARKLGNQRFLVQDHATAAALLRLATKLDPWNGRAWISWLAATAFRRPFEMLMQRKLAARRQAFQQSKD